ncbi:hypothetical protein [Thiothrix winogradskyi]|uniref:Uncharacterized protein n=1 Tax=Thiothrix winogradskyi TaxID=96472 RepID=A0ABY3SYZ8_9GAMM|nr:hypothetical protein [Thiothrix winogradskyi]UJS24706.1 hypothetical protein L2Y54_01335 [Thiothrix winogradskyi]
MPTVFSMAPLHNVHDIHVQTAKGRLFVIDIYESGAGNYDSTVTVLDKASVSRSYHTEAKSTSANDNFKMAVEFIQSYLASIDSSDSIVKIHNPCNCPFVYETEQNIIVSDLGINIKVLVN